MTTEKRMGRLNLSQKEIVMAERICPGSARSTISLKLYLPEHTPEAVKEAVDTVLDNADVFAASLCREEGGCMLSYGQEKISECSIEKECSADWVEGYMDISDRLPMDTAYHLYRAHVFPLSDGGVLLYTRFHHIILDSCSMGLFVQRVLDVLTGKGIVRSVFDTTNITEPTDDAEDDLVSGEISDGKEFWKSYFADAEFETAVHHRKADGEKFSSYRVSVPKEIMSGVEAYGEKENISIPCLFAAAYVFYLAQATNKKDAVFLMLCMNREVEQADTMGCYTLFVPVRVRVDAEDTFPELCRKVKVAAGEASSHRECGYTSILEALCEEEIVRESISEFVFQFCDFSFQADFPYRVRFSMAGYMSNHLTFSLFRNEAGGLDLQFDYQEGIYTKKGIRNLFEAVITILLGGLRLDMAHSFEECDFASMT